MNFITVTKQSINEQKTEASKSWKGPTKVHKDTAMFKELCLLI